VNIVSFIMSLNNASQAVEPEPELGDVVFYDDGSQLLYDDGTNVDYQD
jgi:hypothetical protein